MGAGSDTGALRALPAVHELARALGAPHALAVAAARRAIDEARAAVLAGAGQDADGAALDRELLGRARELLAELDRPSLERVINATGVIVHTNLGRAPLSASARAAVARAADGYANLELDLSTGERGSRQVHVESLLCELTGAQAGMVVNNGAAAVLLAAASLASSGRAIVVSRGQLVEIGGGFRIPEVIAQSGARLVEVGTTNRTRLADYANAVAGERDELGAILRVHPSNFRAIGFVEEVSIDALCALGPPVIDDVGSGVLADASGMPALVEEPPIKRSVAAGAALVCCSGDKLLGGPQAGLLVGRHEAVTAARRHPLARALRIDKLSLAALEATLQTYRDPERARHEIPVLAMLDASEERLAELAQTLKDAIGPPAQIVRATGKVGGGALPLLELEGPAIALRTDADPAAVAQALRYATPPVIARIHDGQVLLDPRTMTHTDLEPAARAVRGALAATTAQ